jgi:hypothetical protein
MEVAPVEITWTQKPVLALSCHESIESRATAHTVQVGQCGAEAVQFQGTKLPIARPGVGNDQQAIGGVRVARPRTNEMTITVQQPLNAYGNPFIGTSVSAAKGSLMAKPFALATAEASGVPPRGRPV